MDNKFSIIGLVFALLAVTTAVFQDELQKLFVDEVAETSTIEKVINRGAETLGLTEKKEKNHFETVRLIYMGLGLAGIIFAIIAFIRDESHRFSGVVGAVGVVAIAWEYVLIGIIIGAVIFIIANLDSIWG